MGVVDGVGVTVRVLEDVPVDVLVTVVLADTVDVGEAELVGDVVDVPDGVTEIVGVTAGVTEIVGVTDGVTEIVGVTEGEIEIVGVTEGVTHGNTTVMGMDVSGMPPYPSCPLSLVPQHCTLPSELTAHV